MFLILMFTAWFINQGDSENKEGAVVPSQVRERKKAQVYVIKAVHIYLWATTDFSLAFLCKPAMMMGLDDDLWILYST